jgi:hypothetical protein
MSQELAVLEVAEVLSVSNVTPGLFAPNGLDAAIARIRERVAGHVPDVSTERGRKEIAALSRRVASSKVYLDDMGKALVSGIKAQAVVIDAERKRMRDELDALRDEVRRPLTEYEDRERMRIEEHEDAISSIIEAGVSACPALSKEETNRLIALVNGLAGRDWQEFVSAWAESAN